MLHSDLGSNSPDRSQVLGASLMVTTRDEPASPDSATVFEQYRDRIYRYILRHVRDTIEAEDLTQETFLRAHRQLQSLRDASALSAWLYRIATHVCYDRFRQASYRNQPESLDRPSGAGHEKVERRLADEDGPRLEAVIEQAEMTACVQDYLEKLPDEYRMAIILHDLHGLTNPEIAQMLGCSLDTVKIRVHRARKKLQAALAAGCSFSHDERGIFVCEPKPQDA
jgi:RNA polymerase sigma-70 factor (ECF subfamily)